MLRTTVPSAQAVQEAQRLTSLLVTRAALSGLTVVGVPDQHRPVLATSIGGWTVHETNDERIAHVIAEAKRLVERAGSTINFSVIALAGYNADNDVLCITTRAQ